MARFRRITRSVMLFVGFVFLASLMGYSSSSIPEAVPQAQAQTKDSTVSKPDPQSFKHLFREGASVDPRASEDVIVAAQSICDQQKDADARTKRINEVKLFLLGQLGACPPDASSTWNIKAADLRARVWEEFCHNLDRFYIFAEAIYGPKSIIAWGDVKVTQAKAEERLKQKGREMLEALVGLLGLERRMVRVFGSCSLLMERSFAFADVDGVMVEIMEILQAGKFTPADVPYTSESLRLKYTTAAKLEIAELRKAAANVHLRGKAIRCMAALARNARTMWAVSEAQLEIRQSEAVLFGKVGDHLADASCYGDARFALKD